MGEGYHALQTCLPPLVGGGGGPRSGGGGPPIGSQDRDGASYRCSAPYTLSRFAGLRPGGKHVTGFSGRFALLQIQFLCHLKGKREIGGTGYCVTYDTESQSRNVLASPLGEEGHKVAKGVQANWIHRGAPRPANPVRRHPAKSVWTVVILIMILDVDVTAASVSKGEAAPFFT